MSDLSSSFILSPTPGIVWSNRVFVTFGVIVNAILMCVIIHDYCVAQKPSTENKYPKLLFYSVLAALLPVNLALQGALLSSLSLAIKALGCRFIFKFIVFNYYLGKFCLWSYALMRLRAVFAPVPGLQYKQTTLNILQIAFIIAGIISIAVALYGTVGGLERINNEMVSCFLFTRNIGPVPIGIFIPTVLDTIISVSCFYLFYKKMNQLYKKVRTQKSQNDDQNSANVKQTQKDIELMYVVRKYLILLCCAVLTSYLLLGAIATTPLADTFGGIDTMINSWCLLLFHRKYDYLYKKIFGRCAVSKAMKQYMERQNGSIQKSKSSKVEMELSSYITNGTAEPIGTSTGTKESKNIASHVAFDMTVSNSNEPEQKSEVQNHDT